MNTISALMAFIEGVLSFFSPCVLPLLPVYLSFLSGGNVERVEGKLKYDRAKVIVNTIFFVLGISVTFFILSLGVKGMGVLFSTKMDLITRIGGSLVILFGLYQLFTYGTRFGAKREKRINVDTSRAKGPFLSFLLGFSFSFSWTPCIGPILSSVLIMASTSLKGNLYLLLYSLGFTIPFLLLGFFTSSLLSLLEKYKNGVKYTVRLGAVIMVILGLLMILSTLKSEEVSIEETPIEERAVMEDVREEDSLKEEKIIPVEKEDIVPTEEKALTEETVPTEETALTEEAASTEEIVPIEENEKRVEVESKKDSPISLLSYSFLDQYGKVHRLSSYKGKVVFLNAWATWCGPCRSEMGDIEALYQKYKDRDDVMIISVAFPEQSGEGSGESVKNYMKSMGYTYPVMLDGKGKLLYALNIYAFPTTVVFDKNGDISSYIPGAMNKENMERAIVNALGE